jgi:hypothetical protein
MTIDSTTEDRRRSIRIAVLVIGLVAIGFTVAIVLSMRSPPQMGADEEVFNTVDALYTAVRNQDEKQLAQCEVRLKDYGESGKLPKDSAEHLEAIINQARGGRWESAAKRLYDFMLAQRRDGFVDEKKPLKKGKSK